MRNCSLPLTVGCNKSDHVRAEKRKVGSYERKETQRGQPYLYSVPGYDSRMPLPSLPRLAFSGQFAFRPLSLRAKIYASSKITCKHCAKQTVSNNVAAGFNIIII